MPAREKPWVLYVLACGDGSLYTGVTNDLRRRLAAHRAGKGARYTRGRGPLRLRLSLPARSRAEALRLELWLKRLPLRQKRRLVHGGRRALRRAWRTHLEKRKGLAPKAPQAGKGALSFGGFLRATIPSKSRSREGNRPPYRRG